MRDKARMKPESLKLIDVEPKLIEASAQFMGDGSVQISEAEYERMTKDLLHFFIVDDCLHFFISCFVRFFVPHFFKNRSR